MDAEKPGQEIEPARLAVSVGQLQDAALELRLRRLAAIERKALVLLLAHLGEFDRRRLHADNGQPSLFAYCVRVLGYSEQAAYKRIQASRAARAHPLLLDRLADGEITLAAIVVLAPHLRTDNLEELLAAARGKPTRELEVLAAGLAPKPDARDCLRALPMPPIESAGFRGATCRTVDSTAPSLETVEAKPVGAPPQNANDPRARIEPLSAQRFLFRFTGSATLRAKYDRALELFRGKRSGDAMETLIEAGLDALLDKLDPDRRMVRRQARNRDARGSGDKAGTVRSRRAPAALRDEIWARDGGRCTFIGPDGLRCPGTARLEIDHVLPFALGGASDDAGNLRLTCPAHNQLLARRAFGSRACEYRKPWRAE